MKEVYQSLVAVEPFTLVVTILNLFVQLFIIKKFFLDKILQVIDRRRETADRKLADAESARQEAQSIKQTYETNLLQAKAEAGQILAKAKKTAEVRSEAILRDTQTQVAQLKEKAARDIAQEKKKALNEAKNEISHIAIVIAGKVVGRSLSEGDKTRLVDDFIDGLGEDL